jgi:hypothetical protein
MNLEGLCPMLFRSPFTLNWSSYTRRPRSCLEDSEEFKPAHTGVAKRGDSSVPRNAEDEVDFHYVYSSNRSWNWSPEVCAG